MRNKSVIQRNQNKRTTLRSKKKISRRKMKISRSKIKKSSRSKLTISLAIASAKAATTVTIGQFLKKSTCMPNPSFMGAEAVVNSTITGLLITKSTLKISTTSRGSMIIIQDFSIVMMISMRLISLFIIGEGAARSIIMIGHSMWNNSLCILLQDFKAEDITKKDLSQFLMGRGYIMSKMIDRRDSSKEKMK